MVYPDFAYRELEQSPAAVVDRVRRALAALEVRRNSTA
jgi:hypothetical protein